MSGRNRHSQISVFHFSNRISKAKILKYQRATERGMPDGYEERASTPELEDAPPPTTVADSMRPPLKRARTGRPESTNGSVALLPGQQMFQVIMEDGRTPVPVPALKHKLFMATSSELSPTTSTQLPPEVDSTDLPLPDLPDDADYGKDFSSYYIADDEEEDGTTPALLPTSKKQPKGRPAKQPLLATRHPEEPCVVTKPPTQASVPAKRSHRGPSVPSRSDHNEAQSATGPGMASVPPTLSSVPAGSPSLTLVNDLENSKKPQTLADMVELIKSASAALATIGNGPSMPKLPMEETDPKKNGIPVTILDSDDPPVDETTATTAPLNRTSQNEDSKHGDKADKSLAIGGCSGDNQGHAAGEKAAMSADYPPSGVPPGTLDESLAYGLWFIQTVLYSWAKNRLETHYFKWYQNEMAAYRHAASQAPVSRSRGRPSKAAKEQQRAQMPRPPPSHINIMLSVTPEGRAIGAFQDLLEFDCLRVNARLPPALSKALQHLYTQLNELIDCKSNDQENWQGLSYDAQLKAHQIVLDQAMGADAKAEAKRARQQERSQQQANRSSAVSQGQLPTFSLQDDAEQSHRTSGIQGASMILQRAI